MRNKIKKLCLSLAIILVAINISFNQPQLQNSYLRFEVGESVVQVLSPIGRGGGTGFAVEAASGQKFIMTNKHVCAVAVDEIVHIKKDGQTPSPKRVIYRDDQHDLCLIEGDDSLSSIDIGDKPEKGDLHFAVGHPGLRQLSIQQGEFIGVSTVKLLDRVKTRKECAGIVYDLGPIEQGLYQMEFICVKSYKTFATTATTYTGNSGSPVVDRLGNVIGVLFAANTKQEKDNHLVPVSHVKRVLSLF